LVSPKIDQPASGGGDQSEGRNESDPLLLLHMGFASMAGCGGSGGGGRSSQ
jgi:hypothetical protein